MYRETYVEIDTNILKNNIVNIRKKYNNYNYYIGVVKGNAYGHGFESVKSLIEGGINYLAVSTLQEAIEIRDFDKNIPILCLQPVALKHLNLCIENNITITISSYEYFKKLIKEDFKNLKVHIALDTGMNRLGFNNKDELNEVYNDLQNNKDIYLEGIFSHLATSGISDDRWDKQIKRFKYLTSDIDLSKIKIVHIGSSNSLVIHPKIDFANGIRLGIIMYGIGSKNISKVGFKNHLRLIKRNIIRKIKHISKINEDFSVDVKTAMSLVSTVIELKMVDKREYVGYGNKYKTLKKGKIAILPIGYMDGLSLKNSGRNVLINNKFYEIVGTVNMGMITVLVDENVKVGDQAIILGDKIDIRNVAFKTHTTPHQLITSISSRLPRIYK